MSKMNSGDQEREKWFVDEVLTHERDIRRWLAGRFPSIEDVDDLVQETFARFLKSIESGPIVNPRAFLFVTARNLALNQIRHLNYVRPKGSKELDPLSIADEVNGTLDAVSKKEELQYLVQAIQSLPRRCRQVITLRKIYGLSQKEVASRLGISVHTVEAQSSIGLRKCIDYFRKHGYLAHFNR